MNKAVLLTFSVCCAVPAIIFGQNSKKSIEVEDIWARGIFRADRVSGLRSMEDGEHYTVLDRDGKGQYVVRYSYRTGNITDTLFSSVGRELEGSISNYNLSDDENKIMLDVASESIYRHSTKERNYIYNRSTGDLKMIGFEAKQSFATFSPDGDKVAYVHENNLYIENFESGEQIQVTDDGEKNKIIYGGTDWVYEEEFAFDKAFFWSPDGERIAYYRFNEERVKEFNMPMYQGNLYPEDYRFKYPKAGEENSDVSVHIYELETQGKKKITETVKPEIEYIPRVKWSKDPEVLSVQLMNRHQNRLVIKAVNVASGSEREIYKEESETYISITDDLTFLKNGKEFIISSEKNGYNHLYKVDLNSADEKAVTKGSYDVTDFYGIDEDNGYVFYSSAEESPMKRAVYRVKTNGRKKTKLSEREGWNSASFSNGMRYFINTYSTADSPNEITLHDAGGKLIRTLKESEDLKKKMEEYALTQKEFFSFETEAGVELNASMMKPLDFDPEKEYPVLVVIYGGPGSQMVQDQWGGANYMWQQMLTQKGYIVVSVDNRGTGGRGSEFKKCTYKQLGKLELEDYIATAKYLKGQDYVDDNRVGIWGWSYGGYMASLAITKGGEWFDAAIAIAPVTTWRFYDTIYTERYMQTPDENENGYDDNSPLNYADRLRGNYLLVHGTADDNVHFQNAAEMINALVDANKQFDMHVYPDRNHGIHGGYTRAHLYGKFTNWLSENL